MYIKPQNINRYMSSKNKIIIKERREKSMRRSPKAFFIFSEVEKRYMRDLKKRLAKILFQCLHVLYYSPKNTYAKLVYD